MLNTKIHANTKINPQKLKLACEIIIKMQQELVKHIAKGSGPFMAAIYDANGDLIAKEVNSVVQTSCSHNHAEMNVIRTVENKLGTYDLSTHNLKLYVTAEPCTMCLGAILWSGIKEIYYGIPSAQVEKITGFDEGFKPNWIKEFKKRGITVYGNIAPTEGEKVLKEYVKQKRPIYKPKKVAI